MNYSLSQTLSDPEILALVSRMELAPSLLKRHIEEEIISLVKIHADWVKQAALEAHGDQSLESFFEQKGWSEADLFIHVSRPEALRRFAAQSLVLVWRIVFFPLKVARSSDLLLDPR